MSIAQQDLDYTTLKWVKDEIQESLNQTRQALEAYVENPNDTTQIRFCATYLHQIYGTLQMVEIYGGALLAEEMEALANAISQGGVSRKEDAYDVLMRAILQLPAYLEHLENGQQDMPVILLPLLNDLRTARGEHLLSENAFFSPNLGVTPPEGLKKPDKEPVDIQKYAKKLRPVYQAALVRWYRNMNPSEAQTKLAIVIRELLTNSTTENAIRLWWVASGIVEGLMDKGLEPSNSVKQLMGHQIDRQIKRLIDEGEQSINSEPPVELLKNLLYYVATSTSEGTRTAQIKSAFNLEHLLPGSVDVNEAFAQLRGSKTDLMQSVSSVIKEDLLNVKDQLDIFVRTKDKSVSDLEPLIDHLHRISDTLAMLGLGDLHKIIQDQKRNIGEIIQAGAQPSEMSLMEVASALLYVESSLEGVQSSVSTAGLSGAEPADTLLPPSEQRQLNNLVIDEAITLVHEIKEAFNAYAVDTANRSIIESTPEKLEQVRGVLAILDLERAANLLHAATDYIRTQLLREDIEPNQKALDLLADVITSIEYFLEAVEENRGHPEGILRVAETSAQELGYSPEAISEMKAMPTTEDVTPTETIEAPKDNLEGAIAEIAELLETDSITKEDTETTAVEAVAPAAQPAAAPPQSQAQTASPASTATVTALPEDDIDEEILEIFIEEADEVVGTMQENLRAWKKNNENTEALSVLRRSYHTIKGSGRLAGAKVVGEFAWAIENMLNRVIDGRLEIRPELFDLLEKAETTLESCIKHLKGELETQPNVQPLVEVADALANGSFTAESAIPDPIDELLGDMSAPAVEHQDEPVQEVEPGAQPAAQGTAEASQEVKLIDIFKKETDNHLAAVENYLANYSDDQLHKVNEPLMRALHTLHGSANMASVENVAELSEHLDRYFATLYDTKQPVNSDAIDVLSQSTALIRTMVEGINDEDFVSPDTSELVARIHELHEAAKEVEPPADADHLSIIHDIDREASDGLEEVVELSSDDTAYDLYDSLEPEEEPASVSRTDEEISFTTSDNQFSEELIEAQGDGLSESVELASDELDETFGNEASVQDIASGFEVEEIELSAEPQIEQPVAEEEEVDHELISIFLDEADEILHNVEALIQGWSNDPNDRSIMEELQRSLHTLKGGARMANQPPIANLSHRVESLLEAITNGSAISSSELPKAVQRCQDWLVHSLDDIRAGNTLQEPVALLDLIQSFLDGLEPVDSDQTAAGQTIASAEDMEDILPIEEETESIEAAGETQETGDLVAVFLEDASEIQARNEQLIQQWISDVQNIDLVNELLRTTQALKGSARMAHVNAIADVAHATESVLEQVTDQQNSIPDNLPQALRPVIDWTGNAINLLSNNEAIAFPGELIATIAELAVAEPDQITLEEEPAETTSATFEVPNFDMEEHMETVGATAISAEAAAAEEADYDQELVEIFLEEAEEIQENIDHILHQWVNNIENIDLIKEVQRSLHTLKGGARMANITPIGDLSHAIESLMEAVTEGKLSPTEEFPKVIHACHDWLANAIERVKQHQPVGVASALMTQLENLLAGNPAMEGVSEADISAEIARPKPKAEESKKPEPKPEAVKEQPVKKKAAKPIDPSKLINLPGFKSEDESDASLVPKTEVENKPRTTEEQMRVKAELIDNMVNHAGEINIYNARIGQQMGQWHFNLKELEQTIGRLREQLRNFELETEAQIMFRHTDVNTVGSGGSAAGDVSFDPLELDRFSYMQQLSRSMVESFDDLTSIQKLLEMLSGDTDVLLLQQSRINTDLQEELMSTRLTPFSSVIARLRRVVRQTCQETGKEAELQVVGAEGEMDRTQLNRIVPALEHILRNAIDHGLEEPAQRKKAKKPESGTIAINFSREGSEVVLRISDDGAGINVDAIRKKAVERGLIEKNSKVEDDEVLDFILQSGFSTAEKVTQISGRGVGMDVVNTEIKQLNGSLHIGTERGKGSTFTIRLPLTVLINQALMVNVDEAIYAISLSNIEHVVRVSKDELNQMITGEQMDYEYAGQKYQHLNIGYVLHGTAPRKVTEKGKQPLLLARSGDHRVALQVDNLIGRQEIVIKSVGAQLSSINSISGATILPDGEVALILDLSTLIRTSHALQKTDEAGKKHEVITAVEEEKPATVLIVDDSITVRKVTQRLLSRHNYEPMTAKDGMDALTVMLERIPDIILLDVEMPRMDGYELATAVRSDPRLKHIPIIMITSRTGDKHRDRALSIGVNMYMGKPYQEHELLENIQSLLHDQ